MSSTRKVAQEKITENNVQKTEAVVPDIPVTIFGQSIEIKYTLSISQMLSFVNDVVSGCFVDGEYTPELKGFLVRCNLLSYYTNCTLSGDVNALYDALYGDTDIITVMLQYINRCQWVEMNKAIDEKIEYIKRANVYKFETQMQRILDAMEDISQKTTEAFSGVRQEDVAALIGSMVDGGIDEHKLAKAFLKQRKDYNDAE